MPWLARRLPFIAVVLGIVIVAQWYRTHRDRMITVTGGVYLSWDGRDWTVLDGRPVPHVGFETPLEGGTPVVEGVTAVAKQGQYLVGTTQRGTYFILSLGAVDRDEDPRTMATVFATEDEWRAGLSALGLGAPSLREPSAFSDKP